MNGLACLNCFGGLLHLIKNLLIGGNLVAWNADNDKTQPKLFQVVLMFKTAVNRYENTKLILRQHEQWAVLAAAPTALGHGLDFMPGKRLANSGVDALV
jgi:hypothetical protein